MAKVVGRDLLEKSAALKENPFLGRAIGKPGNYRQAVSGVLNATYIVQYRMEGDRIVILRVFHKPYFRPEERQSAGRRSGQ